MNTGGGGGGEGATGTGGGGGGRDMAAAGSSEAAGSGEAAGVDETATGVGGAKACVSTPVFPRRSQVSSNYSQGTLAAVLLKVTSCHMMISVLALAPHMSSGR